MMLVVSLISIALSFLFQTPGIERGFTGPSLETFVGNFPTIWQKDFDNPASTFSLDYAFGILFPACTGIMVGANMSGDLKKPDFDIPVGTFLANLFTFLTYVGLCFIMALTTRKQTLIEVSSIMMKVSFVPHFVTMGIFAAALSSALGTIVGGARILQALAKDGLVPFLGFFKVGSGPGNEPRRAIIFIFFGTTAVVAIGEINAIAPILTVLITLVYGFVNFSCFFLSITGGKNSFI
jgi:amino acid transporter